MWAPDVYEGSPTTITAFLASAPKVAAVALFTKIMVNCFPSLIDQWQLMIIFISIASMLLGSFAAIGQNNVKRLLAYSSIGHMGFVLIGLATGTISGVTGLLIYLTIYVFMVIGTFACILSLKVNGTNIESISDLSGLSKVNPMIAFVLSMFLFSLAGIPPLAGFFAKFYIFLSAIESGLYALAIIGVLASVIGAFYYLRIIKIIYFDENINVFEPITKRMKLIIYITAIPVILFFIRPSLITDIAEKAALSLF
jgi:NADH-quinone oxidoreductase subunit N